MPRPKGSKNKFPSTRVLATEQMRFVLTPDQKKMLEFLAKHEGRSKSNLVRWLIAKRYKQVTKGES